MKNLESLKDIPWREQEEAFNEIAKVANLAAMTEDEQNRYDDALRELQDAYSVFEYAMITGKNDGIKEGIKEGKKEGKTEVAKSLIQLKVSDEIISQSTGLSMEEIQKLKSNLD